MACSGRTLEPLTDTRARLRSLRIETKKQTTKIFRTIKAHDEVCIGVEWHPLENSKVATCSWDGTIKYWD